MAGAMTSSTSTPPALAAPPRSGRAPATTHDELSRIALELFLERGFDETTVHDIVSAAGIGRRTFFRYFASKNDLPWGDFDGLLDEFRRHLAQSDPEAPLFETLRDAIVDFNRYPAHALPHHRKRMWLLLSVPSLQAHSTLRYAGWRQVVAEHVAARRGEEPDSLAPQAIAWACLGLSLSSYEQWLVDEGSDLVCLLEAAFSTAQAVFGETTALGGTTGR
jgi:mycofactocin system transcriptional regulator